VSGLGGRAALAGVLAFLLVPLGGTSASAGIVPDGLTRQLAEINRELSGALIDLGRERPRLAVGDMRDAAFEKRQLVQRFMTRRGFYDLFISEAFENLECIDVELAKGRIAMERGKTEQAAEHFEDARRCSRFLRDKLEGKASRELVERFNGQIAKLTTLIDLARDGKEQAVEELSRDIARRKILFIAPALAPSLYTVPFIEYFRALDRVDVELVIAEDLVKHGNEKGAREALKRAREEKEDLEKKLRAVDAPGQFGTYALGLEFDCVCVFIKGADRQSGEVTLLGANVAPPNPVEYTAGPNGRTVVKFRVAKSPGGVPATFSFSVRRRQGGELGPAQSGSVNVPPGSPGTQGPDPPAAFGKGECPVPQ
jgi:tetratricopeptide (TPR) repeat protein